MGIDAGSWRAGAWRPTGERLVEFHCDGGRRGVVGLCLSGGGFRAALFHLGALRRLNELGILSRVDVISAVSGGSILAAYLADRLGGRWPRPGEVVADWDSLVADGFHDFAGRDIRTPALLRGLWWGAAERLRERYASELTPLRLAELPERPVFVFGATELVYRRYWVFTREWVGGRANDRFRPTDDWTVARAVAASSCFPPVFLPMDVRDLVPRGRVPADRGPAGIRRLLLSDGGLYDNLGYMALWNRCGTVLVSDGGGVATADDGGAWYGAGVGRSTLWRLRRYQQVQAYAGRGWQKAFLLGNLVAGHQRGAYWSIRTRVTHFDEDASYGYPHERIVKGRIARIRTDLDDFSEGERRILENHGYLLAAAAVRKHPPDFPTLDAAISVPWEEYLDPVKAEHELAHSHQRRFLGVRI